ncbi:MAG: UvrD-helicase domain-containing protein [Alteromonadaceae bacterium]|nr:UvrD-helicase domain-containing protein [Alteromonadaceae bacterium]
MKVLLYNDLNDKKIIGFSKFKKSIENNNFHQADVKKISDNLYRAKLSKTARLLFSVYQYQQQTYCLVLEYLPNHEYEKSRFLTGVSHIDEDKIPDIKIESITAQPAVYINNEQPHFYYLDKVISFDEQQQAIFNTPAPVVIIGSAGSGKTALMLEKMKQAVGDILYVSHSSFLVKNARNLYYANGYQNDDQEEVDFLSFREYLETIAVPEGREINRKDFELWFNKQTQKGLVAHKLFEEFKGALTGPNVDSPWLSRQDYLALGIRQSLFSIDYRNNVYDIFEKYLVYMQQHSFYDSNIVSQQYLNKVKQKYDFVVVDEVQDITNTQLMLIFKSLYQPGEFILCGDANQIVHPNFFSWSKVKSLFFNKKELNTADQTLKILTVNYRNSPLITAVANRILKLKHARFGSVDKESNFLVQSIGDKTGQLQLLADNENVRKQLDISTARSTKFAVLVMHPEQKAEAERIFSTPLIFSIQEAKGLEYDSIILFNFIHNEQQIFNEIAQGVQASDLGTDQLKFSRAKNKTDKSLETYKFYINSLYVAVTRSVSNLYIVESELKHPLMSLLDLSNFTGELNIQKQESSTEEWQQEAHKLELQGKQEQAENIRKRILKEVKVPWPILKDELLTELTEKAINQKNKKSSLQLFEYSLIYQHQTNLNKLEDAGFNPAIKARKDKVKAIKSIYKNHFMLYDLKQPNGILREVDKYGVDHRTLFNLTPLMTASYINNIDLIKVISERGPDKTLVANHGLNAWQMLLSRILLEPNKIKNITESYHLLAPDSLSIQVDGRLEKLDDNTMFGFLVNVFFSLWYGYLPGKIAFDDGITAANLYKMLAQLPDAVLSPIKKKQSYISRYLSVNEVSKSTGRNRKLFKRIKRGHYILNPELQIRLGDIWHNLHDLLSFEGWEHQMEIRQSWMDDNEWKNRNEYFDNNIQRFKQHGI